MAADYSIALWLLKLGALVNLYFFATTCRFSASAADLHIVIPGQILFAVSAFRCLFPVRYKDNIVLHNSAFSSIFLTRLLATFAEVAFIYQFSHVIRVLNLEHVGWVNALSWLMVAQVVISQFFVWGAILSERLSLYFYEELGWAIIFAANTIASGYLYLTLDSLGGALTLIQLNLLFGLVYLPWQCVHLRALLLDAWDGNERSDSISSSRGIRLTEGFRRSVRIRNRSTDAEAWGGLVGLTWMVAYWATLIPMWVHHVVEVLSLR